MNEPIELQGFTFREFNNLMGQFSKIAPDWAQYIKLHKNKTNNIGLDSNSCEGEMFDADNGHTHNLSNFACCIVGEVYGNQNIYRKYENDFYCETCSDYSKELIEPHIIESSIISLLRLKEFIIHVKEEHSLPNLKVNKSNE